MTDFRSLLVTGTWLPCELLPGHWCMCLHTFEHTTFVWVLELAKCHLIKLCQSTPIFFLNWRKVQGFIQDFFGWGRGEVCGHCHSIMRLYEFCFEYETIQIFQVFWGFQDPHCLYETLRCVVLLESILYGCSAKYRHHHIITVGV